jgi:hypothetical protein
MVQMMKYPADRKGCQGKLIRNSSSLIDEWKTHPQKKEFFQKSAAEEAA